MVNSISPVTHTKFKLEDLGAYKYVSNSFYRIEWVNIENNEKGHGSWIPYGEAKTWADTCNILYPKIKHTIVERALA